MIKLFSLLVAIILLTSFSNKSIHSDEKLVQNSVLNWADSVFYKHEEFRFEQYHAEYTDMYQIAVLRLELYQGKQENLEKIKQKGFYKNLILNMKENTVTW